jgi:microcystin degradation protein MlrC
MADIPDLGASVYVVADDDVGLAQACADELGKWLYARRADWHMPMPSTAEILDGVSEDSGFPMILSDRCDNPGGGSPGDSTGMLRTFVDRQLEKACMLYIVDSDAVALCMEAGVGAEISLKVGGKSSALQGKPVPMHVEVVALSDGKFTYDGPMFSGLDGHMGLSAHVREAGVHVLLVSEREQPFDTAFARTLGLDPRQMRYIGVKSTAHFRAGYESWAGSIHSASEPSVHNPLQDNLVYKNTGRRLYPFENS